MVTYEDTETEIDSFVGYRKYFHWLTQVLAMTNEACLNGQRNDS